MGKQHIAFWKINSYQRYQNTKREAKRYIILNPN